MTKKQKQPKPVTRQRVYKYGEPVIKTVIIRLTAKQHKKLMRKVGKKTITEYFKKVTKIG